MNIFNSNIFQQNVFFEQGDPNVRVVGLSVTHEEAKKDGDDGEEADDEDERNEEGDQEEPLEEENVKKPLEEENAENCKISPHPKMLPGSRMLSRR